MIPACKNGTIWKHSSDSLLQTLFPVNNNGDFLLHDLKNSGDFKYWLTQNKVPSENISLYLHQLKQMLHCESEEAFLELSDDLTSKMSTFKKIEEGLMNTTELPIVNDKGKRNEPETEGDTLEPDTGGDTFDPIIVDREPGLKKAIRTMLPDCPILTCWNHLRGDFKHWLTQNKVPSDKMTNSAGGIEALENSAFK
jgi:hypothetical protein